MGLMFRENHQRGRGTSPERAANALNPTDLETFTADPNNSDR
jgi:hypothetical protein